MAPKKKPTKRAAVAAWRTEALRLHLDGWNYAEIAREKGLSPEAVRKGIEAELSDDKADPAERIKLRRAVKGAQLDAIIKGSLPDAQAGSAQAAGVVIQAIAAQMKLEGLSAPEKLDVNAKLTLSFDAHQELLNRLAKYASNG